MRKSSPSQLVIIQDFEKNLRANKLEQNKKKNDIPNSR